MFHQSQGTIFGPPSQPSHTPNAPVGTETQVVSIPLSQYTELMQAVEKSKWTERAQRSESSIKELEMKAEYSKYVRTTTSLLQQLQKISQSVHNPHQFYTQNLLEAGISLAEAEKLGANPVNVDNWAYVSDHFQQILEKSHNAELESVESRDRLEKANTRITELEKLLAESSKPEQGAQN